MNKIRSLLVLCLLLAMGSGLHAQHRRFVKQPPVRIIAKADVYWSAVSLMNNFPAFFPLELEINATKPGFSFEMIASPGFTKYNTQTSINSSRSLWGGVGLRYYFLNNLIVKGGTGPFVEAQYLFHVKRTYRNPITSPATVFWTHHSGPFLAVGYQVAVKDRIFFQGRLSFGYAADDDLYHYQVLQRKFTVLPWLGLGLVLH